MDATLMAAVAALAFAAGHFVGWERTDPPAQPRPCVCAPPSAVALVAAEVERLRVRTDDALRAFATVAEDCVVPGAWMDAGVVPVPEVLRRAALTGRPVED